MGNIHSFRFNKVVTKFPKDCELKNKSFLLKFSILILTNSIHRFKSNVCFGTNIQFKKNVYSGY